MPTNRKKAQDDDPTRDDMDRELDEDVEEGGPKRAHQSSGSNPGQTGQGTNRQGGNQGRGSSNTKKRK